MEMLLKISFFVLVAAFFIAYACRFADMSKRRERKFNVFLSTALFVIGFVVLGVIPMMLTNSLALRGLEVALAVVAGMFTAHAMTKMPRRRFADEEEFIAAAFGSFDIDTAVVVVESYTGVKIVLLIRPRVCHKLNPFKRWAAKDHAWMFFSKKENRRNAIAVIAWEDRIVHFAVGPEIRYAFYSNAGGKHQTLGGMVKSLSKSCTAEWRNHDGTWQVRTGFVVMCRAIQSACGRSARAAG